MNEEGLSVSTTTLDEIGDPLGTIQSHLPAPGQRNFLLTNTAFNNNPPVIERRDGCLQPWGHTRDEVKRFATHFKDVRRTILNLQHCIREDPSKDLLTALCNGLPGLVDLTTLNVSRNSLDDTDVQRILNALPPRLVSLDVSDNRIGPDGTKAVVNLCSVLKKTAGEQIVPKGAKAVEKTAKYLAELDLSGNQIGPKGAEAVENMVAVVASVTSIDVGRNNLNEAASLQLIAAMKGRRMMSIGMAGCKLGVDGAKAIAELVSATPPSVRSVTLLANQFDDATVAMLLQLKKENPTLMTLCGLQPNQTEADFSGWDLTVQDAKLLAPEIVVHASLTSLSLHDTPLDDEVVSILCQALHNSHVQELDLSDTDISTVGLNAVADRIAVVSSIISVNVLSNKLDVERADLLLKVKDEKPNLRTLCGLTHNETKIELRYKRLGPGDAKLLAPELLVMASLTKILVDGNELGDAGTTILCNALRESTVTKVQELGLTNNQIGPEGARAVAAMAAVVASITHIGAGGIDLRSNNLGDEGWGAIFAGVCSSKVSKIASINASNKGIGPKGANLIAEALRTSVNASLTSLDLSGNALCGIKYGRGTYTAEGIKAIADALRVNASMTRLEVSSNNLGEGGKAALREALQGRSGFELLL